MPGNKRLGQMYKKVTKAKKDNNAIRRKTDMIKRIRKNLRPWMIV